MRMESARADEQGGRLEVGTEAGRCGMDVRELTRCEYIRKELVGHISIFILSFSFKTVNLVHICWSATASDSRGRC